MNAIIIKSIVIRSILVILTIHSAQAQTDSLSRIAKLFIEIDSVGNDGPGNSIFHGQHPETYTFTARETIARNNEQYSEKLKELKAFPVAGLTRQEQISRQIMLLRLENTVSQETFRTYLMPYNAEGGFFNNATFFLPRLPFNSKDHYEQYLGWLPSYVDYLSYNQNLLKQGMKEGILGPRVIVENLIQLLQPWVADDWLAQPFGEPFGRIPESINEADRLTLMSRGEEMIRGTIVPAYKSLLSFLETEYLAASPTKVGISNIKNGRAYYENRVRHYTTLDITPDSVFNLGQSEVKRIRAQMDKIIEEVEFEGYFADFLQFLRTDPQFYPKTGQDLLNQAAWLSKKAEGQLPRLFDRLYSLPFTVEPVPQAIAPTYTAGRYVGGSRRQNRAGIYWVNTYNLPSRTLYTLPALSLHEAVPGHHLQNALASETQSAEIPRFRRSYYISAFGEGWGLYSEFLGEEMGMYSTPYELFGRYTYEMWRACRLVVDVGMHYKGWTREEAVAFMTANTALSLHEINSEIDRYIGWPGQALSYKVGELTIISLRKQAEDALGDDFDVQRFHHHILKNGSVPLPILREEIENYISEAKVKKESDN